MEELSFHSLNLSAEILRAIDDAGYTQMTPIQAKGIPVILSGKDAIGQSSTGTGKTAAFGIPGIEMLADGGTDDPQMLVLCPASVWQKARTHGNGHNYVQFDAFTEWTAYGMRFSAVRAEHSDAFAIGVIIEDLETGKTYYVTGDTLYNKKIFADLPDRIDVIFLPINGVGNNMNATDAARFFKASGAKIAVPLHVGMFDENTPDLFEAEPRVLPEIYKEIKL